MPDHGLRILVGHDLSTDAERAAALIARAGWPPSTVVRVVSSPIGISVRGRHAERDVRLGDAATEVVAAAREWAADLVVLGAHCEPLLRRGFVGSVTRTVLDRVESSVLVVRQAGA